MNPTNWVARVNYLKRIRQFILRGGREDGYPFQILGVPYLCHTRKCEPFPKCFFAWYIYHNSFYFPCSVIGRTPGGYNRLDIPTSRAYFLGAPSSRNLLPNFIGCIRDFTVDGYEPITNSWAGKPDYTIVGKRAMRLCNSSDEQWDEKRNLF